MSSAENTGTNSDTSTGTGSHDWRLVDEGWGSTRDGAGEPSTSRR